MAALSGWTIAFIVVAIIAAYLFMRVEKRYRESMRRPPYGQAPDFKDPPDEPPEDEVK